ARLRYVCETGRGRSSPRRQGIVIRVVLTPRSRWTPTTPFGRPIHFNVSSSKPSRSPGAAEAVGTSARTARTTKARRDKKAPETRGEADPLSAVGRNQQRPS